MDLARALQTARRYHAVFTPELHRFQTPLSEPLGVEISEVIFLASNLIFATELYLKIGIRLQKTQPPRSHNLLLLHSNLLPENRARINDRYELQMRQYRNTKLATSHDLFLSLEPEEAPIETDQDLENRTKIQGVLMGTGDSYTTWRYLFSELKETEPRRLLSFHHTGLHFLCQTLDALLSKSIFTKKEATI